jgi:pimeloyl-ACP methyl ester carboxylesterase
MSMNVFGLLVPLTALVPLMWNIAQGGVLAGSRCAVMHPPPVQADGFVDSGGVRIHYVDAGQGSAVVLIHGYIANADRHWVQTGVFANLAADHRVIALDCRGHGLSDKPAEPEAYGTEMANDVVRLLDHLRIRRAHIVGFSMGAFIAGHLATTRADRLASVTFVGHHPIREWPVADERDAEASARDLESDTPFRSLILAISPPDAVPSEDRIRTLSRELVAANNPKALAAYHRGLRGLAVTDGALAAVSIPMLAIVGSEDPAFAGMQALKTLVPALPVVVVDGAAHGGERGVLRRPEFLSTLQQFLRSNQ